MSHAFSFLMGDSITATRELRQETINQLIRITRKNIIILDGDLIFDRIEPKLLIEQNTKCAFRESLVPYFSQSMTPWELYTASDSDSGNSACIFCLNP